MREVMFMERFMSRKVLILALWMGLSLASLCSAAHRDAALSADGDLYQVKTGTYGDLFPNGMETDPANSVLALEVVHAGAPVQRYLVPGTQTSEIERTPALVYEDASRTLFLVWLSVIHSNLNLMSFDGTHWSEQMVVTKTPYFLKSSPQFAITRDVFQDVTPQSTPSNHQRTILHIVWTEENAAGLEEVMYSPIILEDGTYLGQNPIYRLNDFEGSDEVATDFAPAPALLRAPTIHGGRDGRTVVVAFASAATHRLVGLEIDVLPREMGMLADGARATIIELGAKNSYPSNIQVIADKARATIIELGSRFHPEVALALADQTRSYILAQRGKDLKLVADGARATIIELGGKLSGRGLRATQALSTSASVTQEIPNPSSFDPDSQLLNHFLLFRTASARPAPKLDAGLTEIKTFISDTGEDAMIAWATQGHVFYCDSNASGWSEPRDLPLSGEIDVQKAYEILDQRFRNH
jgi:hypothetical protein